MLLTVRELELLKLLCWCRTVPPPEAWTADIYNENDVLIWENLGLVAVSRNGKYIRPRPNAYKMLETAGYSFYGDVTPQTKQMEHGGKDCVYVPFCRDRCF